MRADLTAKVEQVRADLAKKIEDNRLEIEKVRADLAIKIAEARASQTRWAFVFWATQMGAILLILFQVLQLTR